jgi:hypothetical protein
MRRREFFTMDTRTGGGEDVLLSTVTLVSSSELKALRATPKVVITAPGAGKARFALAVFCEFLHGAAAYVRPSGGDVELIDDIGAGNQRVLDGSRLESAATNWLGSAKNPWIENSSAGFDNSNYSIQNNGGAEWTTGDGTLRVTSFFVEIDVD